jgi:predicted MFS family arabinose efflux permease
MATCGCALFSVLTAAAPTFEWLVLCRAGSGAAAAGIVPLSVAWIGDTVAYDKRQETLARFMGAALTGMMAGQWFGGFALQYIGWRPAFLVLAGVFALSATLLYRQAGTALLEESRLAKQRVPLPVYGQNMLRLFKLPRVRWVLGVTALEGALAYGALAFIPSQLVTAHGFTPASAGSAMVLFGIGGLLYSQLARHWLALLGETGLARSGGALVASAFLVVAWSHDSDFAVGACFVAGLGLYMLHNTLQTQATQMAPAARGTAVALFAGVLFLAQSLGVWTIAGSLDRGFLAWSFSVAAIGLVLLGAWVAQQLRAAQAPPSTV